MEDIHTVAHRPSTPPPPKRCAEPPGALARQPVRQPDGFALFEAGGWPVHEGHASLRHIADAFLAYRWR
jgi:hypothetical protein